MFLSHITDNCLIKIISGNFNWCTYYRTAQWNYCNICGSSSDIYNHISTRSCNIDTCSNCCCNWFFNNCNFSCSCLISCILYRLLLNLCYTTWYTDTDSWLTECFLSQCLLNKVLNHLLCYGIIRNNTLAEWSYCYNVARCSTKHQSCFFTNRFNLVCISVKRYYGRLF